jgi:hypothetical protein
MLSALFSSNAFPGFSALPSFAALDQKPLQNRIPQKETLEASIPNLVRLR